MTDSPDDPTRVVRDALERSAQTLDEETLRRLQAARHAAVAAAGAAQRRRAPPWLVPAGAFAMASLAAVLIAMWPGRGFDDPVRGETAVATVEDFDLLVGGDDAAIADDMEFYQWLALIDDAG